MRIRVLPVLIVLSVLAGCGGGEDGSDDFPVKYGAITGLDWELVLADDPTEFATLTPDGDRRPTLEFNEGQAEVFNGCGNATGTAKFSGRPAAPEVEFGTLVFSPADCPGKAGRIADAMTGALKGKPTLKLDEGNLVIYSRENDFTLQFLQAGQALKQ